MLETPVRPIGERPAIDLARQPLVLAWELTRACTLACVHCRAAAQLRRDPRELTTAEALALVEEVARFDVPPVLVLTGGDPLRRRDLLEIVRHATALGIRCTLTPAGTPLASRERLAALHAAGLARVAISLDGPDAETHDSFRRVRGSFGWSLAAVQAARELGLPVQLHTTLCRQTLPHLPAMADLAEELGAVVWAVFCLVPTGRAQAGDQLTPEEYEAAFHWLAERRRGASWDLKLTEGYHFRRVLAERGEAPLAGGLGTAGGIRRAGQAVNAGAGFCFVSHIGEVQPSGFLPLTAGNVREDSLVALYQHHPLFVALRDPARLTGRCGRCRYRALCGGSRSRAYATTGDLFADDPACGYGASSRS